MLGDAFGHLPFFKEKQRRQGLCTGGHLQEWTHLSWKNSLGTNGSSIFPRIYFPKATMPAHTVPLKLVEDPLAHLR